MSSIQKKFCNECGKELANFYEVDDDICRHCFYWQSDDNYKIFLELVTLGGIE